MIIYIPIFWVNVIKTFEVAFFLLVIYGACTKRTRKSESSM